MERIEKNGKELFVGDCVLVPEPSGDDKYNNEFVGTINGFTKDGNAIIFDSDDNYFFIEPKKLEFFDGNIQLTPVEIIKLKKMVKSK
jgi:hypothetical protein